ncbi:hypothetical protein PAGL106935_03000 [Paenibacillus glucanolyticus]|jgi:hypothetical protein
MQWKQYKQSLPQAKIAEFEQFDHNIFEPDEGLFVCTADSLMEKSIKSIHY